MQTQEVQLLCLQQNRMLQLWLGPLAMTLHFQHLIFPIEQLTFIIRTSSLNFSNNFLPFDCLPGKQHSFCLSWHCNLSATGRRLAIALTSKL